MRNLPKEVYYYNSKNNILILNFKTNIMEQMINFKERFSGVKQTGEKMCEKIRFLIFIVAFIAGWNTIYVACGNETQPYLAFKASGTLTVRLNDGKIVKGILNTVDGFPLSVKQKEQNISVELPDVKKLEFSKIEKDSKISVKGVLADGKNIVGTVYGDKTVYCLTIEGFMYKFQIKECIGIEVNENEIPVLPKNMLYAYIETKDGVYQTPEIMLQYKYTEGGGYGSPLTHISFGLKMPGDINLDYHTMKYVHFCTEVENYGKKANSIFVNIHKTDHTTFSTRLRNNSYITAYTSLGEMNLPVKTGNLKGIYFGSYDSKFAESVKDKAWTPSQKDVFVAKGTATIYLKDNTKVTASANTLQLDVDSRLYSYLTEYSRFPNRASSLVCFTSAKKITFTDSNNKTTATAIMEAGDKIALELESYLSLSLFAWYDGAFQKIELSKISSIEIDMKSDYAHPVPSDVKITDSEGNVFHTPNYALDFILPYTSSGIPYFRRHHKIQTTDGLSINYGKIKKIDFFQEDKNYKIKLLFKDGNELVTSLEASSSYYNSFLQFLTSQGMARLVLRGTVKSIEFE
jgi:small nuclear ribonucleoprotein (snRNP)-like protein